MQRPGDHDGGGDEERLDRLLGDFLRLREDEGLAFEAWVGAQGAAADALRERYERYRRVEELLERALPTCAAPSAFFHRRRASSSSPGEEGRPLRVGPGDEVGEFVLVRRLGRGAMGEVWEAEQRSIGRRVALKLLLSVEDGGRRESRFDLEPRAAGRVQHPGVVAVHATGKSGGVRWIAQELVPGGSTLEDFIRERRNEEPPRDFDRRVAELFVTLAEALQRVHEVGVLHRDLKPRNILVTPEGQPKIADFGLARVADEPSLTGSRHLLGTFPYMSPEQVRGEPLDPRSDVFSLGVVLYEVLSGVRPFQGGSHAEIMMQIATAEPLDLRARRADIDADLAAICAKAIEKRVAERYATAGELAEDLARFLRGETTRARPAGPLRRARKWMRRHRSPVAWAVALVLVAVPLVALLLSARADRLESEKQRLLESSGRFFERGDVAQGIAEAQRAIALDPADPAGHQALAIGLSRVGWQTEAHAALERARGWDELPDEARLETPLDHLAYGIHVLVLRLPALYERAITHLERAAEDPKLEPMAWYALYQLRRATGDRDGARDALDRYIGSLRSGTPVHGLMVAERLELEAQELGGEAARARLEAALAEIDRVAADERFGPRELGPLLIGKRRGRILVVLGRDEEAAQELEAYVAAHPADAGSLANLALARHRMSREPGRDAAERAALRAEAEARAREAARIGAGAEGAWSVVGAVALDRLAEHDGDPRELADWEVAKECVARLREFDATSLAARELEQNLVALEAGWLEETDREEEALALWREAAEVPGALVPRIRMADLLVYLGRPAEALPPLREARELWERARAQGRAPGSDELFADLQLALLAAASEDEATREDALRARDLLLELETQGGLRSTLQRAYLAWYLARATDEAVRDCEAALKLCARLRKLPEVAAAQDVSQTLDQAEEACR